MNSAPALDNTPLETDQEFIQREALKLPLQERARLAEMLIASLDPVIDEVEQVEIDKAWAEEASRRLQEYLDGRAVTIPADEVMRKLHAKFSR